MRRLPLRCKFSMPIPAFIDEGKATFTLNGSYRHKRQGCFVHPWRLCLRRFDMRAAREETKGKAL
jgi:hypothetical protein